MIPLTGVLGKSYGEMRAERATLSVQDEKKRLEGRKGEGTG